MPEKKNPYRLGPEIEPIRYMIELEPNLTRFTFRGHETISLRAKKPFAAITLHATELKVAKAILWTSKKEPHPAAKISYDEKMETVEIRLGRKLPVSNYLLYLEFEGSLNEKMHGFYRTSYEIKGRRCWGAATQFEATDARRCFPCWDEPDRKAAFELALRVPKKMTALSNMPATEEKTLPGGRLKRTAYAPTPVMSPYLLAFVVADLERIEGADAGGIPIRIWTTPGKKEQGRFALKVAQHALPYFTRWFGIRYALPKLDMVALPDFASGAMENWGLVTYRETALLIDPVNSSAQARQRVAEAIDHELAHQWFGNLVTMAWWTDLWLNEGFASYMGPKAVNDLFPEWKIWNQYVATEYLSALGSDALRSSHPIEIPVQNPHEIREIFDEITYSKGSSVNRMLEHYLGEETFRKGLSVYLKKYAYQNAKTLDLWKTLEKVSGKPVRAVMASFTQQEGYPVLTAARRGKILKLRQKRFLFDGGPDPSRKIWTVPIGVTAQGMKKPLRTVLRSKEISLRIPVPEAGWIKVNPGQSGFHRTAYPPDLLKRLAEAIPSGEIPAIDCLGIVDDAVSLARAGFSPTSGALELIAACKTQTDYNLWLAAAASLGEIESVFHLEPDSGLFSQFCRRLFSPLSVRLSWFSKENEGHLDALLRSLLIGRMGHYGDRETIARAKELLASFLKTGELSPDLRGPVYMIAAENGGGTDYENLFGIYRKSGLQEEKVRVLRALTRFPQREIIGRALAFSLSADVRAQDAFIVLAGFGSNRHARKLAWEFIKRNWKMLVKRYASGGLGLMTRIIDGATSGFTSPEALRDIENFFKSHPVPGTERAMKQSVEAVRANIGWRQRDENDVRSWLSSLSP